MRKKMIIAAVLLFGVFHAGAQTWAEWFNQKSTQKKYLLEQIAALKVYMGYVSQGYDIVKDGTQLVGDIRDGDLNLHKGYFGRLKSVNPSIGKQDKVAEMVAMQADLLELRQKTLSAVNISAMLNADELTELKKRLTDMSAAASKDLDQLTLLLSTGKLELTDDQRISQLDKLYESMKQRKGLQSRLHQQVMALIKQREQMMKDVKKLKDLYGPGGK